MYIACSNINICLLVQSISRFRSAQMIGSLLQPEGHAPLSGEEVGLEAQQGEFLV